VEFEIILLGAGITILALNLMVVAFLSYRKYRSDKLLLMSIVFSLFFIKGLLLSLSLFFEQFEDLSSILYIWIIDFSILILLYITSLKR
jgi:hypothetical protein